MITSERLEELQRAWDECDLMEEKEYREWYEDLTDEEQAQIDVWDKQYTKAVLQLCEDILANEQE